MNVAPGARLGFAIALGSSVAACTEISTELEREASAVPIEEIILIERDGADPIPADGSTQVQLTIWIPRRSDERSIVLKSSLGSFPQAGGQKEITLVAGLWKEGSDSLRAMTPFQADTVPGTAAVTATVGKFTTRLFIAMIN